jgi:hypothetical protein
MTLKKIIGYAASILVILLFTGIVLTFFLLPIIAFSSPQKITNLLQVSSGVYVVESVKDEGLSVVDGRHEFIYELRDIVSGEKMLVRDNVFPKSELPVGTTVKILGHMEIVTEYPQKSPGI